MKYLFIQTLLKNEERKSLEDKVGQLNNSILEKIDSFTNERKVLEGKIKNYETQLDEAKAANSDLNTRIDDLLKSSGDSSSQINETINKLKQKERYQEFK